MINSWNCGMTPAVLFTILLTKQLMPVKQIEYNDLVRMLKGASELLCQNRDELCRIDAVIGDGDHGITITRAMNIVSDKVSSAISQNITALLGDIAWELMDCDGGATGPLYGSLFLGMSEAASGLAALDGAAFAHVLEGGLQSIQQQTKAKVGDKTMMDALIPAVEAAKKAASESLEPPDILRAAVKAARQGSEFTSTISARYGRAKYQGARTIGYPDPGSVSITMFFQGLLNGLEQKN
jgi:phosphoenolpyruvate---glycerone phosphotransferase subunit DhaL